MTLMPLKAARNMHLSRTWAVSPPFQPRHHPSTRNNNNTNNHRWRWWLSSSSWIRWLQLQVVADSASDCLFAFVSVSAASIIIVLTIIVRFHRSESSRTGHRQIEPSDKLWSISWLLAFRPSSSVVVLHHSLIHHYQRIYWRITGVSLTSNSKGRR